MAGAGPDAGAAAGGAALKKDKEEVPKDISSEGSKKEAVKNTTSSNKSLDVALPSAAVNASDVSSKNVSTPKDTKPASV